MQVKALNKGAEQTWTFNAKQFSTRHFDHNDPQLNSLADRIAQALASETDHLMLQIDCYAKVGKAQEVYPSEELVLDKGNSKTKKSKILYAVNEHAAMHSQKLVTHYVQLILGTQITHLRSKVQEPLRLNPMALSPI